MKTKQEFLDRKIASKKSTKVIEVFDSICPDFHREKYKTPSEYMENYGKGTRNLAKALIQ